MNSEFLSNHILFILYKNKENKKQFYIKSIYDSNNFNYPKTK